MRGVNRDGGTETAIPLGLQRFGWWHLIELLFINVGCLFLYLIRRQIFNVRCYEPIVAGYVSDTRLAIAMEHISGFTHGLGSRRNGSTKRGVNIGNIKVKQRRSGLPLVLRVANQNKRVAEAHLRIEHRAIRSGNPCLLTRVKRLPQEVNQPRSIGNCKAGCDRVPTIWSGVNFHAISFWFVFC